MLTTSNQPKRVPQNPPNHKYMRIAKYIGILAITLSCGCTVKYSFSGASIPPEAKSVSVDLFQNIAPQVNPTLSNQFTEALKERFVSQTRLTMVNSFGDFAFSGQITTYNVSAVSIQGNETAAQNRLTIGVSVKFVNAIDPKSDFDRSFSHYADYEGSQNFADVEDQLVQTILEKLIDDIFNAAAANW